LPKDYKYYNYILQIDLENNENIVINVENLTQYEIILLPCKLNIKKIIDYKIVKYLICTFHILTNSDLKIYYNTVHKNQ
jgi:hypothetical protein